MKRSAIPRVGSTICSLGLAVLLALGSVAGLPGPAGAQTVPPSTPQVTVLVKNYQAEYDVSTSEFLEREFEFANSPAFGLIDYTVVTTLTQQALDGSVALVIDESSDMSLTTDEAALIHHYVNLGGRVGLFAFPRKYWTGTGANAGAYQGIGDIWGINSVGDPAAADVTAGTSSATVSEPEAPGLDLSTPYTLTEETASVYDLLPFSPISASNGSPLLVSAALNQAPVAVINANGIFVTNSIGDAVQGGDSDGAYSQFVTDAIVWLASGSGPLQLPNHLYLPMLARGQ
jgi:hypothetical protein